MFRPPSAFSNPPSKYNLWLVAGDSTDLSRPQKVIEPLKIVSLRVIEVARSFRMSANIPAESREVFLFLQRSSSSDQDNEQLLYIYEPVSHHNNNLIYLDICLILKPRIIFELNVLPFRIIRVLHIDSLCNIHNPYNSVLIASRSAGLSSSERSGLVSASVQQLY